jgi:hypothetical protein
VLGETGFVAVGGRAAVMSTRMPAAANASAVANPMPLAAPVTTAVRPVNCSSPAMLVPLDDGQRRT